jgi:hypothetical protein
VGSKIFGDGAAFWAREVVVSARRAVSSAAMEGVRFIWELVIYFFRALAQFITTVMGVIDAVALSVLIRNRWPSRAGT